MQGHNRTSVLAISLSLAAGIFLLDLSTPPGYAQDVLYLIPLIHSAVHKSRTVPFLCAGCFTLLIGWGFVLSSHGDLAMGIANRLSAIAAIWIVAILADRYKTSHRHELDAERLVAKANEEQFQSFMDHLPAFAWIKNTAGRYVFANRYFLNKFGLERTVLLGKTDTEVFMPSIAEQFIANDRIVIEGGQEHRFVETFTNHKNEMEYGLATKFLLKVGCNSDPLIGGMAFDMTDLKRAEQALKDSEERFRRYFELGLVGLAIMSPMKSWLEVNDRMCEILGYSRSELLKRSWMDITYLDDVDAELAEFNRVMERQKDGYSLEKRFVRKDGRVIYATISVKCLCQPHGAVDSFIVLLQDITDQKHMETEIRESEHRLQVLCDRLQESEHFARATLDALSAHIVILDEKGTILAVNRSRFRVAWGDDTMRKGDNYLSVCERANRGHDGAKLVAAGIRRVIMGELEEFVCEQAHEVTTERTWFEMHITRFPGGGPIRIVVAHIDITGRKEAEKELLSAHGQLRNLTNKLMQTEEEERARLARELHDEFAQILTGMAFTIVRMRNRLKSFSASRERDETLDETVSIEALIDRMILATRRIASGLRPSILDQLGLIAGLRWLGKDLESRTDITCDISVEQRLEGVQFVPLVSTTMFRICQEMLTNITRHAGASLVTVDFREVAGHWVLSVHDNGRGIKDEEIHNSKSLGLTGIRERVELLGGTFAIYGLPEEGTSAQARIPTRDHKAS